MATRRTPSRKPGAGAPAAAPGSLIAVLAEKPSVARDLAKVLGAQRAHEGYLEGNGYIVTWAIGHLVALAQPHEIRPEWRHWSKHLLPIIPHSWPLIVYEKTRHQFAIVQRILNSPQVCEVVCATDAGREGELIFRYIYEAAQCQKPFRRLWISSLTPEAIRRGMEELRDGRLFDPLAAAAKARSRADWLVGMNLSRAYTLACQEDFSVGRVQTPTLAMVVERELAIRSFVPEDYCEVVATFSPTQDHTGQPINNPSLHYQGVWFHPAAPGAETPSSEDSPDAASPTGNRRLPADGEQARAIVARASTGEARILSLTAETRRIPPPQLYDLTELQRHANRLYSLTAQQTLTAAQALYERHKLISYPRTDSRHLSQDVARTLPRVIAAIRAPYEALLAPNTALRPLSRRFVDDSKVTDHHAIIPTPVTPQLDRLSLTERRVYDLICRRLLAAWHPDHVYDVTTVITTITNSSPQPVVDHFHTSGATVTQVGWKVLDPPPAHPPRKSSRKNEPASSPEASSSSELSGIPPLPPGLFPNQPQRVLNAEAERKTTRPPRRFTEATLLTAMETAGKTLDDKELSDAMKDSGLGTPSTRAAIIETLLERGFLERDGKSLRATDKGIRLIEIVHPEVKSPAMTGQWESLLRRMERGELPPEPFLESIADYVRQTVAKVLAPGGVASSPVDPIAAAPASSPASAPTAAAPVSPAPTPLPPSPPALCSLSAPSPVAPAPPPAAEPPTKPARRTRTASPSPQAALFPPSPPPAPRQATLDFSSSPPPSAPSSPAPLSTPSHPTPPASPTFSLPSSPSSPPGSLEQLLRHHFGFSSFRPNQREACEALTAGKDVLLVMPTGSGKSLCYQLPALARGGAALVLSPLIALMDDQVRQLQARGFCAQAIHSARSRADSRDACRLYLNGELQFLFIAPERLRVPGFPEMLARRQPSLIAIDEAHCISEWGHDFRPDYRRIGQYLPLFRPAPVIALTATATPQVQADIIAQLSLSSPVRCIHGFRRHNLAIESVEAPPSARPALARELLLPPSRRPAIVYAPTRRATEALADAWRAELKAGAYHAGLDADHRRLIQELFLRGDIEVMVATIAFGMGIDKPDIRTVIHTALPASLEAYYQEIGRAGRDGAPARAILMHSYADRFTHDYFLVRDYPPISVLEAIFALLTPDPIPRDELRRRASLKDELFDRALEKLWVHGGALIDANDQVTLGEEGWQSSYAAQGSQKARQIEQMLKFAEAADCRMSRLIRHFGDLDDLSDCRICDNCAPHDTIAGRREPASPSDQRAAATILQQLRHLDGYGLGRLLKALPAGDSLPPARLRAIFAALVRSGYLRIEPSVFEKDGKRIEFERVYLTPEGRAAQDFSHLSLSLPLEPVPAALRRRRKVAARLAPPTSAPSPTPDAPSSPRQTRSPRRAASPAAPSSLPAAPPDALLPPSPAPPASPPLSPRPSDAALEQALRAWRLAEARRFHLPAFRILTDRALLAIVQSRPATTQELLALPGVDLRFLEKYGAVIFRLLDQHR